MRLWLCTCCRVHYVVWWFGDVINNKFQVSFLIQIWLGLLHTRNSYQKVSVWGTDECYEKYSSYFLRSAVLQKGSLIGIWRQEVVPESVQNWCLDLNLLSGESSGRLSLMTNFLMSPSKDRYLYDFLGTKELPMAYYLGTKGITASF